MAASDDDKRDEPWQSLSAMVDGEADTGEQARCLAQWAARADVRARWHEYQVIGDALRSGDLIGAAAADATFLRTLRGRLASERRPAAVPLGRDERALPRWFGGLAVAAGVGAVALTLTMISPTGNGPVGEQTLAAATPAAAPVAPPARANVEQVLNGQLIRDARLDRYFAAHRQGAIGASLHMPGAVVRSVDTIVLESR